MALSYLPHWLALGPTTHRHLLARLLLIIGILWPLVHSYSDKIVLKTQEDETFEPTEIQSVARFKGYVHRNAQGWRVRASLRALPYEDVMLQGKGITPQSDQGQIHARCWPRPARGLRLCRVMQWYPDKGHWFVQQRQRWFEGARQWLSDKAWPNTCLMLFFGVPLGLEAPVRSAAWASMMQAFFVISGQHVQFYLVHLRSFLRKASPFFREILCLGMLFLLGWVIEPQIPVYRALWMASLRCVERLGWAFLHPWDRGLLTVTLVLWSCPLPGCEGSFFLTMSATAILHSPMLRSSPSWLHTPLFMVFWTPVSLFFFRSWTWWGLFLQSFLQPWMGLVCLANALLFLSYAYCPPLALLCHRITQLALELWLALVAFYQDGWLMRCPVSQGQAFVLLVMLLLGWRSWRSGFGQLCLVSSALLLAVAEHERPPPLGFRVDVFHVGQALSVLVQTHQHALLYDTSARPWDVHQALWRSSLPRKKRLDTVLISHADKDHAGGIKALQSWSDVQTQHFAQGVEGWPLCQAGQHWQWDGVDFEVVWPGDDTSKTSGSNAQSCVLAISNGSSRILLAGDIDASVETALIPTLRGQAWDMMLASHHGSRTGNTEAWLYALKPKTWVVSSGYAHGYGHPHQDVLTRVRTLPWKPLVHITAYHGDWSHTFTKKKN